MGFENYLLLSGSTGLVGQFLLVDLMRSRLPVAVLVRSGKSGSARIRIEDLLRRFEEQTGRQLPRPVILESDLNAANLGLTSADKSWFLRNVRSVIHSAANLSFKPAAEHPDNEPFRTNIDGTAELIRLCQQAGVREFHAISSAYVCGLRTGRILETDGDRGQPFSNDYEQSKLSVERMVNQAGFESVTIYRPSIVVDSSAESVQTGDRTIYYAFSVFQMLRQRFGELDLDMLFKSMGMTGAERKNIVPANWVARCIIEIFRRPALHGATYHLTNPRGTELRNLLTAFGAVIPVRKNGRPKSHRPTQGWGELTGVVDQFMETFTPYFRDDPMFDQTHLIAGLQQCGMSNCPPIEHETLLAISTQQLAPRSSIPAGEAEDPPSLWLTLADELREASQVKSPGRHFNLTLTGANGGDWIVGRETMAPHQIIVIPGRSSSPETTIYMPAKLWEKLITDSEAFTTAIENGAVLIQSTRQRETIDEVEWAISGLRKRADDFLVNQQVDEAAANEF